MGPSSKVRATSFWPVSTANTTSTCPTAGLHGPAVGTAMADFGVLSASMDFITPTVTALPRNAPPPAVPRLLRRPLRLGFDGVVSELSSPDSFMILDMIAAPLWYTDH